MGVAVMETDGLKIYHNSPSYQNEYGGNIVRQPVNEFLTNRTVLKVTPTNVQAEDVINYSNDRKKKRWTIFYNCEDYINEIINQPGATNRLRLWGGIGVAFLGYKYLV